MGVSLKGIQFSRQAVVAVVWGIAILNLLIFGFFVVLILGAFSPPSALTWFFIAGVALFFIGDFYLLRFIFLRAAVVKTTGDDQ